MFEYQRKDIVRLREAVFDGLKEQLWFKDNVFEIYKVGVEGMLSLVELDVPIPAKDILPIPINKKHAGNIYYDPVIAASVVGPDDDIPVHYTDYTYFMDSFGKVTDEDGTTLRTLVEEQKFKYVHEVQHWLREKYETDDLRIHHKLVSLAEVQSRNLWNLRDSLLDAGVSSYQFLYEMANMLYLRWLAFNDDKAFEQWKELEQTAGDDLLEKYQEAIQQIKQQTHIYSAPALEQTIAEVSKCAYKENIASLFDLMLDENCKAKASGAILNYTPRVLGKLLVKLMQPKPGEYWHDPAAGFSGFLVEIDRYMRDENIGYSLMSGDEKKFQLMDALSGMEILKEVARIGFCNARFHELRCEIKTGDSLTTTNYQQYDGVICEPPIQMFSLAGQQSTRDSGKNKQLEFVELIIKSLSLQSDSRAAILLPESFLYKNSLDYKNIRKRLFEEYNLHTILRLPKGIYPNSSISMCALFLSNNHNMDNRVLVYDMLPEKIKPEKLENLSIFKDFIETYRSRMPQKRGLLIRLDEIRDDDYKITFEREDHQDKEQMDTPSHYLSEANKVVREIRSLLAKMEKDVND